MEYTEETWQREQEQEKEWQRENALLDLCLLDEERAIDGISSFLRRWVSREETLKQVIEFACEMRKREWLRLLGQHWTEVDNIFEYLEELKKMVPAKRCKEMMDADELAQLKALPRKVTVYRGCGPLNVLGASWSLDRDIATRFPTELIKYRQQKPLLVTASVERSKIIALKLNADEKEVITFSAEIESVKGIPHVVA